MDCVADMADMPDLTLLAMVLDDAIRYRLSSSNCVMNRRSQHSRLFYTANSEPVVN